MWAMRACTSSMNLESVGSATLPMKTPNSPRGPPPGHAVLMARPSMTQYFITSPLSRVW